MKIKKGMAHVFKKKFIPCSCISFENDVDGVVGGDFFFFDVVVVFDLNSGFFPKNLILGFAASTWCVSINLLKAIFLPWHRLRMPRLALT